MPGQPSLEQYAAMRMQQEQQQKAQAEYVASQRQREETRAVSRSDPDVVIVQYSTSRGGGRNIDYNITANVPYEGRATSSGSTQVGYTEGKSAEEYVLAQAQRAFPGRTIIVEGASNLVIRAPRTEEQRLQLEREAQREAQILAEKQMYEEYQRTGLESFQSGVATGEVRASAEAIERTRAAGYTIGKETKPAPTLTLEQMKQAEARSTIDRNVSERLAGFLGGSPSFAPGAKERAIEIAMKGGKEFTVGETKYAATPEQVHAEKQLVEKYGLTVPEYIKQQQTVAVDKGTIANLERTGLITVTTTPEVMPTAQKFQDISKVSGAPAQFEKTTFQKLNELASQRLFVDTGIKDALSRIDERVMRSFETTPRSTNPFALRTVAETVYGFERGMAKGAIEEPLLLPVSFYGGKIAGSVMSVVAKSKLATSSIPSLLSKQTYGAFPEMKYVPGIKYATPLNIAGAGLTGTYAIDVYGRTVSSEKPIETLGKITSTELIPFTVGMSRPFRAEYTPRQGIVTRTVENPEFARLSEQIRQTDVMLTSAMAQGDKASTQMLGARFERLAVEQARTKPTIETPRNIYEASKVREAMEISGKKLEAAIQIESIPEFMTGRREYTTLAREYAYRREIAAREEPIAAELKISKLDLPGVSGVVFGGKKGVDVQTTARFLKSVTGSVQIPQIQIQKEYPVFKRTGMYATERAFAPVKEEYVPEASTGIDYESLRASDTEIKSRMSSLSNSMMKNKILMNLGLSQGISQSISEKSALGMIPITRQAIMTGIRSDVLPATSQIQRTSQVPAQAQASTTASIQSQVTSQLQSQIQIAASKSASDMSRTFENIKDKIKKPMEEIKIAPPFGLPSQAEVPYEGMKRKKIRRGIKKIEIETPLISIASAFGLNKSGKSMSQSISENIRKGVTRGFKRGKK